MAAPFYNCIKGTTAGASGTGAFTPNAASAGFFAWSTVATGWIGLVRYEDPAISATAFELAWSYWNGTTLSRATTQTLGSSSGGIGSSLTLTATATAAMVEDPASIAPSFGDGLARGWIGVSGVTTTPAALGKGAITVTGTATTATISSTSAFTEMPQSQSVSATTANAQAGYTGGVTAVTNSTAGRGGWEFLCRFGVGGTLPTSPRLWVGMTQTTLIAVTTEPSAQVTAFAVFGKDSTDTNIQLITNDGTGSGTKIDTGIPMVANGTYKALLWSLPGSLTINALLIRMDTGAIWLGSTATDVPGTGVPLRSECVGGLSSTTGTAFTLGFNAMIMRAGQ